LLGGDLSSVGAVGLVENVLCADFDLRIYMFSGEKEVKSWRCDDNFCVGVCIVRLAVF